MMPIQFHNKLLNNILSIIGAITLVSGICGIYYFNKISSEKASKLDKNSVVTIGWIYDVDLNKKHLSYIIKYYIGNDSIFSTSISIKNSFIGDLYVVEYLPENPEINRVRLDRKVRRPDWYKDRQLQFQYNGAIARGVITKVEDMQYAGSLVTFTFRAENDSIYNVEEWVGRREYQIGDSVEIRYITLYPRSSYIINDSIPQ